VFCKRAACAHRVVLEDVWSIFFSQFPLSRAGLNFFFGHGDLRYCSYARLFCFIRLSCLRSQASTFFRSLVECCSKRAVLVFKRVPDSGLLALDSCESSGLPTLWPQTQSALRFI